MFTFFEQRTEQKIPLVLDYLFYMWGREKYIRKYYA